MSSAVDNFIAASPVAIWLGFSANETPDGYRFSLAFHERHIGNPGIRALHGGVIAAFLEFSAQCALIAHAGDAFPVTSVNADFDYLRSSRAQSMNAKAAVHRVGRRIAFIEATGWQTDETNPVALARFRIRPPLVK